MRGEPEPRRAAPSINAPHRVIDVAEVIAQRRANKRRRLLAFDATVVMVVALAVAAVTLATR